MSNFVAESASSVLTIGLTLDVFFGESSRVTRYPFVVRAYPSTEVDQIYTLLQPHPIYKFDTATSALNEVSVQRSQFVPLYPYGEAQLASGYSQLLKDKPDIFLSGSHIPVVRGLRQNLLQIAENALTLIATTFIPSLFPEMDVTSGALISSAYPQEKIKLSKSQTSESQLEELTAYFHFRKCEMVVGFLQENPFLIDLLFETRQKIDEYFGAETRSALEIFSDPEDVYDRKLFVLILTNRSSDKASAYLDQMDQEWWLDQPYEAKSLMNIDVEYVDGSV